MRISTLTLLCSVLIVTSAPTAFAAHPQILVAPDVRDAIKSKLASAPWAKRAFATLQARIDPLVARTESDPQYMSSRLFMNWQTHYAVPIVENSRWVGGEGRASVPTPRFGGARDWATKYVAPANPEDLKPFNDQDGKVWLLNKETGKPEWADAGQTGRMFETVNERIINTAAEAGFLYWITGDEKYACYATEILWTYMNGLSNVTPPRLPPNDRGMSRIIGVTSFEVIHEDIVTPLAVSYDFLHDYLQEHGKDVALIQNQLKRFGDRVIEGGSRDGNWNLNQARIIAYAGLPLEDNQNYSDKKGKQYYMDVVLNADLPAQLGINRVIKTGYDADTAIWPEAPGYGFGTTKDIALIATLTGDKQLLNDPLLGRALLAQEALTFPNGWSIGLGDTNNTRINATALELLIASARQRGDAEMEARLTRVLNREIDAGAYDRSAQANVLALTQYVGELSPLSAEPQETPQIFFGKPLNVLMQQLPGEDPPHSLAAAMFGTDGGHVHANGLAIELYGAGVILGADPGRGSSYWQPDHSDYYSQPPAHNTVIINGKSDYAIRPHANPAHIEFTSSTNNISVAQATFHYTQPQANQQRTLALIRTSPTSGFYCDVFRSSTGSTENTFHDYIYHNIGQSLTVSGTGEESAALKFADSQLLTSKEGCMKGYDYFHSEQSALFDGPVHGEFMADVAGTTSRCMDVWLPGGAGRRIFTATAPPDHAARESLPSYSETPMHVLIVRQDGDAWKNPFVAVYEPHFAKEQTIAHVREAKVEGNDPSAASSTVACVVEGSCTIAGKTSAFTVYLVQNDHPKDNVQVEGHTFTGGFSALIQRDAAVVETLSVPGEPKR